MDVCVPVPPGALQLQFPSLSDTNSRGNLGYGSWNSYGCRI